MRLRFDSRSRTVDSCPIKAKNAKSKQTKKEKHIFDDIIVQENYRFSQN